MILVSSEIQTATPGAGMASRRTPSCSIFDFAFVAANIGANFGKPVGGIALNEGYLPIFSVVAIDGCERYTLRTKPQDIDICSKLGVRYERA
jgi:hypothetical protein